jgi:hypothetical protein
MTVGDATPFRVWWGNLALAIFIVPKGIFLEGVLA